MNSNMESGNDKIDGNINTLTGTLKERMGKATGDQSMETEGTLQKTKGQAQKLRGAIHDVIQKGQALFGTKPKK